MIEGVRLKHLKVIPDERGRLMEILRRDDPEFLGFGQVYMTSIYPGVVKGWHFHRAQADHVTCVHGMIKLALYDGRPASDTYGEINEHFVGEHRPLLVVIPAGVYHGWKCVSPNEAIVINTVTEPYHHAQPDEERLDAHDSPIPYDWARKDG